ncbi:hypothetical protein J6590_012061 [Homalodisca vitripennis]|nr:hypothetical protein J6590_012061 [Homalodisca vitripennis]
MSSGIASGPLSLRHIYECVITTNFLMYADDVKIFEKVPTNLGHEALQNSLNNIGDWCRANGMELNATKSVVLSDKCVLYKYLVLPILEYGSVISTLPTPYQFNHTDQLQSIQGRSIKILGSRLGFTYRTTPISEVESQFDLLPLHRRRQLTDLVTQFKTDEWTA